MKIVLAQWYELDVLRKGQHFISQEVAEEHVKEWPKVTDWGRVIYIDIEVTE